MSEALPRDDLRPQVGRPGSPGSGIPTCASAARPATRVAVSLAAGCLAVAMPCLSVAPAMAQQPAPPLSGWEFTFSPYAWIAGVDGTLRTPLRREPDIDISADFQDLVSNLRSVPIMAMAEVRYGRFGLVGDLMNLSLEQDVSTRDILYSGGKARVTTTGAGIIGLFRVVDLPEASLDLGGGIRPWWVSTRVSLDSALAQSRSFKQSTNWVDPVIAARLHLPSRSQIFRGGFRRQISAERG